MRNHLRIGLIAGTILFLSSGSAQCSEGWWNEEWKCRKILIIAQNVPISGDVAKVDFSPGGLTKEDGSDIRILYENKEVVPHKVVFSDPWGITEVIFKIFRKEGFYYLYYNNPRAYPPYYNWEPRRGLILETRKRGKGNCQNWSQMRRLIKNSTQVYGRRYWPKIFDGYNPFGPSDNYISIYKGYIYCPESGKYGFATASDDASFLFIDRKLVAQWPGWHGARGGVYAQHRGEIKLKNGIHRIEYYHVEGTGAQAAVAGWKKPSDEYYSLIPESAFLPLIPTVIIKYEKYGQEAAADFSAIQKSNLQVGDMLLTLFDFYNQSGDRSQKEICYWDFGDGIKGSGNNLQHIYINPGKYKVTLTIRKDIVKLKNGGIVRGEVLSESPEVKVRLSQGIFTFGKEQVASIKKVSDTTSQIIRTQDFWWNKDDIATRKRIYFEVVKRYLLQSPSIPLLQKMVKFFQELEKYPEAIRACEALLKRSNSLKEEDFYNYTLLLGDLYRKEEVKRYREAIKLYRAGLQKIKKEERIIKIRRFLADTYLYHLKNYKQALKEYEKILEDYPEGKGEELRLVRIHLGDLFRRRGDFERAKEEFYRAGAPPRKDYERDMAREGSYLLSAEYYLRNNKLEEALKVISEWEDTYPWAMLGPSSFLKAKVYYQGKKFAQAIEELKPLALMESSPYRAESLFLLGDCYVYLGNYARARQYYNQVITQYPDSPFAGESRKRLGKLK